MTKVANLIYHARVIIVSRERDVYPLTCIFTAAWPDDTNPINRGPFPGGAGSTVRLDCSITPGVVVDQYYVTWRSQTQALYVLFPPHFNRDPFNIDSQRYSLDPGNFSLFIHDVTPADGTHDYFCILGVEDPHPDFRTRQFVYTQTESERLSLFIVC